MASRATWRSLVAWSYLAGSVILLPVLVESTLEQAGIIHGPSMHESLPDAVVIALMFDALFAGGFAMLYWPIAAVVVPTYWTSDRPLALPALFFLFAHGLFFGAPLLPALSDSQPLVWPSLIFGWLFAIMGVRAWLPWLRERT